jgi:hypothetical protein
MTIANLATARRGFTRKCIPGSFRLGSGGVVDDLPVGRGLVTGAEPQQRLEGGVRGAAAVVAEDEFVCFRSPWRAGIDVAPTARLFGDRPD